MSAGDTGPRARGDGTARRGDLTARPRRLVGLTQEHGLLEPVGGQVDFGRFPVGTVLALVPFHVSTVPPLSPRCPAGGVSPPLAPQACATAAMHPVYYAHEEGEVVALWHPVRGW